MVKKNVKNKKEKLRKDEKDELTEDKSIKKQESEEEKQAREMKEIERSFIGKKIDGFFPTPPDLIETMFSMARVFEGETVLELLVC